MENQIGYAEYLEHHGVKGMRWGIRRYQNKDGSSYFRRKKRYLSDNDEDKRRLKLKRNIAVGVTGVASILALYGGYRWAKAIKDENVKIAIEKGKKFAEQVRQSDIAQAKKYPNLFKEEPDSYYQRLIREKADEARHQSFSEAFKNVKQVRDKIRKEVSEQKTIIKDAKKVTKKIRSGKYDFFTLISLQTLAQFHPDILKNLGFSIVDGTIYVDGKKL